MKQPPQVTVSIATAKDLPSINSLVSAEQLDRIRQTQAGARGGADQVHALVAREGDSALGVVVTRWLAPELGSFSGPMLTHEDDQTAAMLLNEMTAHFRRRGARLIITLRPTDDLVTVRHCGFQAVARISFMVATRFDVPTTTLASPPTVQAVSPEKASDRHRWQNVLAGTFEETRDCPALRSLMSAEDTIATFEHASFDHQEWLIATLDNQDLGCLILGFDEEEEAAEILYVGVIPSLRSKGYGRQLMQVAAAEARQRKLRRMGLGVDATNEMAINLYLDCGFYEYDQRDLWLIDLKTKS